MVPKECGHNQSETAHSVTFPCLPATAKDGELIKMQHFCLHGDTICYPNSSYVTTKRYEMSACGCNNNTDIQQGLFSRFLPLTYAGNFLQYF